MGTFKRTKVVMLPTENKSNIYKNDQGIITYNNHPNFGRLGWKPQHLYFLSDDEIKEVDWMYDSTNHYVEKRNKFNFDENYGWKKIIATTDKSLQIVSDKAVGITDSGRERVFYNIKPLSEPSKSFIQKYCDKGGIDEVMVEYELQPTDGKIYNPSWQPKVASDNTITIKPIKDKWDRQEVEQIIINLTKDCFNDAKESVIWTETYYEHFGKKWFKENL